MLRKSTILRYRKFLFCAALLTSSSAIFSGCKDTGGEVEGYVSSGINDSLNTPTPSKAWNFLNSADYVYDSNYIAFDGSGASLRSVDTTFNDAASFNRGTLVGTAYSGGVLTLGPKTNSALKTELILERKISNLIGIWHLDSNLLDSSSNGLGGVAKNGAAISTNSKLGAGSLDTSGGTKGIEVANNAAIQNLNQLSVCFWINPTSFLDWARIIQKSDKTSWAGASSTFSIQFLNGANAATAQFVIKNASGTTVGVNFPKIQSGVWSHMCATYDGNTMRTFLNSVALGSASQTGAIISYSDTNNVLSIGATPAPSYYQGMNGYLDEVSIWNTALTPAEVSELFEYQALEYTSLSSRWTPKWSNLVGYWKMDGNWLDSSGHGASMTAYNSPTFSSTSKVGSQSAQFSSSSQQYASGPASGSGGELSRTVVGWVRLSSLPTTGTATIPIYWGGGVGRILPFRVSSSGVVTTNTYWGAGCDLWDTLTGTISTGVWYHVGATVNRNGNYLLYVNGVVRASRNIASCAASVGFSTSGISTGANGSTDRMSGLVDDIAGWREELSGADIALIYNRQKQKYAGSYDSPVLDMGASGAPWTSLESVSSLPFYKELSGDSGNEGASAYPSMTAAFSTGLQALWHFNDLTLDSSGNGQTLTLNNVTASTASSFGKQSASFNGSSSYATFPNTIAFGTSDMTIAAWVNLQALTASNRVVFSQRVNSSGSGSVVTLYLNTSNQVVFSVRDIVSASVTTTFSTALEPGRWYLLVGRKTATDIGISVNASAFTSTSHTLTGSLSSGTLHRYVGANYFSNLLQSLFYGSIDELAVWTRALSPAEVLELYRRGANRVKYQVRSCIDSSCSCKSFSTAPAGSAADCDGDGIANASDTSDTHAANWIGPDGTAATYFSELQNNTSVDASGNPTGNVKTTGLTLDWSGSFFAAAARPTANRYFQYRVYLESDDENNLCSGSPCMPDVKSISVGPTNRYYGGSPSVVNNTAQAFTTLKSMTRSDSGSCTTYQVSTDGGTTWKWWNGTAWTTTVVGVAESNYLSDYSETRLAQLSSGNFKFKAFLNTNTSGDFTSSCALSSLGITYSP